MKVTRAEAISNRARTGALDSRQYLLIPSLISQHRNGDVLPNNMLPLGISSEFSPEYVGLIMPRSGLGSNQGLHPRNIVGVIDADYRGEWKASLRVDSAQNTAVYMKDKAVMQVMFVPVADVNEYILVNQEGDEANHSAAENAVVRGDGGFGSTDA